MTMIDFILTLAVGLVLGYRISAHIHLTGFREILNRLKVTENELRAAVRAVAPDHWRERLDVPDPSAESEKPLIEVEVTLEQHHGQLYAFRKDTDTFLGQGADGDALIDRLNQTMKPCRVVIRKEDGAELLQKNNG